VDRSIQTLQKIDFKEEFINYPFYIITNPFKGFSDLKYEKRGNSYFAVVMMVVISILAIADNLYKGFVLSGGYYTENKQINATYIILMAIAPVVLFVVANWSITCITNGNGKMRDIFMVYAYALYPKVILSIIGLAASNIVTMDESALALFFYSFGSVAFAFYLFIGLIIIHEYNFTQGILMIIFTIVSMCIIVFVVALFLTLSNEVITFFKTIYQEIMLRL
jgi:hypothetical protein